MTIDAAVQSSSQRSIAGVVHGKVTKLAYASYEHGQVAGVNARAAAWPSCCCAVLAACFGDLMRVSPVLDVPTTALPAL
ncbi:hypothetical protein, partial [Ralstonia sp.]|uniref:hypothetical protein n=1 Tax=Ralstonia sp. TaxID=54061 RepID=UPI00257DDAD1